MLRTLAVCCMCLLLAPLTARAEWHFTPLLGATFAGSTTLSEVQPGSSSKRHVNFGGAVSHFGDGIIGVEGVVIYTRHFFEFNAPRDPADPVAPAVAKSYTLSATADLVLTVPKRWTEYFLRPYVSTGFGMLRAVSIDRPDALQSAQLFPIHSTMPAFDVGGGAIGFLSQGTGVRFDLRYHAGLRREPRPGEVVIGPDLHLHYMTAEIGLVIRR